MGFHTYDSTDWDKVAARTVRGKSRQQIFSRAGLHPDLDPAAITLRESRDSAAHPQSTALLIGVDVTGSMGNLAELLAREGLKTCFEKIYDRKPISSPHIAFAGIGDLRTDNAPLQVSQFEADKTLIEQLPDLWLEGWGGGNNGESYPLLWQFAGMKTSIDCFEKRGRKGILFTMGDEPPHPELRGDRLRDILGGEGPVRDVSAEQALMLASRSWDVYHLVVEQGGYCQRYRDEVYRRWHALLGPERVLPLTDYTKMSEVIVSLLQVLGGEDKATVAKSWSGDTSLVVANAMRGVQRRPAGGAGGVTRF